MPPPGGFDAIKYKRNLPLRGPSGLVILGGVTAVCAYGFYRLGKGNLEKRCVEKHLHVFGKKRGQADVKRVLNGPARRGTWLALDPPARYRYVLSLTKSAYGYMPTRERLEAGC